MATKFDNRYLITLQIVSLTLGFLAPLTSTADGFMDQLKAMTQRLQQYGQPVQQSPSPQAPPTAQTQTAPIGQTAPATDSAGNSAPWSPPSDTPQPAIPLDEAKSPEILGVRLGMSPQQAYSALMKHYPKSKIKPLTYNLVPFFPADKKVLAAFSVGFYDMVAPHDRILVQFTAPPNKPMVWRIHRTLDEQHIDHGNVLTSLREKYGRESMAGMGNSYSVAPDDASTGYMWWVFSGDGEQFKLPQANVPMGETIQDCVALGDQTDAGGGDPPSYRPDLANVDTFDERFKTKTWCNSPAIFLKASFSGAAIVNRLDVIAQAVPTLTQSAKAEYDMMLDIARNRQQESIEKAKQERPSL